MDTFDAAQPGAPQVSAPTTLEGVTPSAYTSNVSAFKVAFAVGGVAFGAFAGFLWWVVVEGLTSPSTPEDLFTGTEVATIVSVPAAYATLVAVLYLVSVVFMGKRAGRVCGGIATTLAGLALVGVIALLFGLV